MKKDFLVRRNILKTGLGLLSSVWLPVSAKETENNNMEMDLSVNSKMTSMSIHEKGKENEKPERSSGFYLGNINAEVHFKNCIKGSDSLKN